MGVGCNVACCLLYETCPNHSVLLFAAGFDPLSHPGPRLAIAFASGALPTLEALIRGAARKPESPAELCQLLEAALAHGPAREAAALAASLAKGARLELSKSEQLGQLAYMLGASAATVAKLACQPDSPAARQLFGLQCGMVCSLGAAFAAGLPLPLSCLVFLRTKGFSGLISGHLYASSAASFLAACSDCLCGSPSVGAADGAASSSRSGTAGSSAGCSGPGAVPAASLSWRQVLLQLQPLGLLRRCFQMKGLGPDALHDIAFAASSVTLALTEEMCGAVRAAGGTRAAASLQPALLRRVATALQDADNVTGAVAAAAAAALWEAWQAGPPADSAREAALLSELRAALGWGELRLPLPSPAEALALLRTCGNPLCMELGGDSEAALLLPKTCRRCHTVSYCSSECQLAHWRSGHKEACGGAGGAAGGSS